MRFIGACPCSTCVVHLPGLRYFRALWPKKCTETTGKQKSRECRCRQRNHIFKRCCYFKWSIRYLILVLISKICIVIGIVYLYCGSSGFWMQRASKNLCITNLVQLLPGLGKEPFEVQRKVMNAVDISFAFLVIHPTHWPEPSSLSAFFNCFYLHPPQTGKMMSLLICSPTWM